nr:myosin IC heavy chain-like [Anser cygnoides]
MGAALLAAERSLPRSCSPAPASATWPLGGSPGGVPALIPTACPAGGPLPAPSRAERALCWRRRSAPLRAGHGQGERGRPGQRLRRQNGEPRGARLGERKQLREGSGGPGEAERRAPGVPGLLRGLGPGAARRACPEAPQHRRQERARGRGRAFYKHYRTEITDMKRMENQPTFCTGKGASQ